MVINACLKYTSTGHLFHSHVSGFAYCKHAPRCMSARWEIKKSVEPRKNKYTQLDYHLIIALTNKISIGDMLFNVPQLR